MKKKLLLQLVTMFKLLLYGTLIQCFFLSVIIASPSGAQEIRSVREVKCSIDTEESSLKDLFSEIESKTKFRFSFYKGIFNPNKKVKLDITRGAVSDILLEISSKANLRFKQINNNIKIEKLRKGSTEKTIEVMSLVITITGKVTSGEDGTGLPGVNVIVKGTTHGTVTDIDGNYSVEVPDENAVLVFTSVGFIAEEVTVGSSSMINISLLPDITALEEIVVVGYGTQKRADVTGSIVRVTTEETAEAPNHTVLQSVQGRVPGVNIASPERPGQDPTLRIRGNNSLTGSNDPLIVVDGIIYWGSISDFNPNDIESVDILKDASATAVYGARAANGVLLITTKRGKTSKPQFNFNTYVGIDQVSGLIDVMDGARYLEKTDDYNDILLENNPDASLVELTNIELENIANGNETDWIDETIRNGFIQNYHLSVSGQTDRTNYYIAGNYFEHEGVAINDEFSRITLNVNLSNDITDWFNVSVKSAFSSRDFSGRVANLEQATRQSPYGNFYDEDGPGGFAFNPIGDPMGFHPLIPTLVEDLDKRLSLWGLVSTNIQIPFVPGLKWTMNYANNFRRTNRNNFENNQVTIQAEVENGIASKRHNEFLDWTFDNIINYRQIFAEKHSVDLTLLFSREKRQLDFTTARASGFVSQQLGYNSLQLGSLQEVESNLEEQNSISQMVRFNYGFDERYAITFTYRRDGFSAFAQDNKYASFPAAAFAWTISNEGFMQNNTWLNHLKLRLSYGKNGNQGIDRYSSLARINTNQYLFGNGGSTVATFNIASLSNNALTWETTATTNIGIDFQLFNDILTGGIDAYLSNTENLLQDRTLPRISGFSSVLTNIGETENKGIEMALNSAITERNNFTWSAGLVFSLNRSRITSLGGLDADRDGVEDDDISNNWFIGEDPNVIFGFKTDGIYQIEDDIPDGFRPGDFKLVDTNNDDQITPDDRIILGSTNPNFTWGLTNTFTLGQFRLYTLINAIAGGDNFYIGNNFETRSVNRIGFSTFTERFNVQDVPYWTPDNPTNEYPRLDYNPVFNHPIIESRSFVRIQDITLSYTFKDDLLNKLKISNLKVYGSVKNLYTFTSWSGYNPETASTIRDIPFLRNYIIGLNLSF